MRKYYTYRFSVQGVIVHYGFTQNLKSSEQKLRLKTNLIIDDNGQRFFYRDGNVEQIGCLTTLEMAKKWLIKKSPVYAKKVEQVNK